VFGVSFLEIALVALVALIVVGPQKRPGMMRTTGEWVGKLRRLTSDMRAQTGIDDILREEGIDGVRELRTLLKGEHAIKRRAAASSVAQQEVEAPPELLDEFPIEGPDAGGALPEDLVMGNTDEPSSTDDAPLTPPSEAISHLKDPHPATPSA
jgi:sec-independent protein translocase protein TatB